jgi:hypothetical protein
MPTFFPHVLITRYGIGVTSVDWYAYKIKLFKSVTLPSIAAQVRPHFFWTIVIDSRIPAESLSALKEAVGEFPFVHLIPMEVGNQPRMVHGGFPDVWEQCQDYLLKHGLIEDPTGYVITSLIDDDDAWNTTVVSRIDEHIENNAARLCSLEPDTNRGFLVRHSVGMTFANGMVWDVASERFELVKAPSHSMSIFVFARFSSNVAACSVRHGSWHGYTTCVGFEVHVVDEHDAPGNPMWVYLRHPRAISQVPGPKIGMTVDSAALNRFRELFAINIEAFVAYQEEIKAKNEQHSGAPDDSKFDLLDLQFRITAFKRQIHCLGLALEAHSLNAHSGGEFMRLRELKGKAAAALLQLETKFRDISQRTI